MIVLSIGTAHPWNVAGTGRDIVVGERLGARVFTAIAAVSAQDAGGVRAMQAIGPNVLRAQLAALPWDAAGSVRVGALGTAANVREVVKALQVRPQLRAVIDPVQRASRGGDLYEDVEPEALAEFTSLTNAVLTPNLDEAAALLGTTVSRETLGEVAAALQRRGAAAVLLKGGHLDGDPVDALATRGGVELFAEPRIAGSMHGIGCTLAMAMACALAQGGPLRDCVVAARAYVRAEIARH